MPVTSLKVARTMMKSRLEVLKYGERTKISLLWIKDLK